MKDMNEYRKKKKTQAILFFVIAGIAFVASGLAYRAMAKIGSVGTVVGGVLAGVTTVMLVAGIARIMALKNDAKLKEMNTNETDERLKMIASRAAAITFYIMLSVMLAAMIVSAFIDPMFSYALLAMCFLAIIIYIIAWQIYQKKY